VKKMTTLQQIDNYEFWAECFPIIREPGWEVGHMSYGSVRFRREQPFDVSADYRHRTWAIGIVTSPNSWHYCWQAHMHGGGISDRLDIPLDSTPEAAYAAAHAKASEWFASETKRMLTVFQPRNLMMEQGEE
jgi:hypothetical protein